MENIKKNITGLTVICDQNTLPLSVNTIDINRKLDNNRKTGVHEIKNVQKTLDKINLSVVKDYVKINLIGDKGYITKNKFTPRMIKQSINKYDSDEYSSLSYLLIDCFIITRRPSGDILNRNINIVTPKKKNQKIRTSISDKKLLKDRYKIEHPEDVKL